MTTGCSTVKLAARLAKPLALLMLATAVALFVLTAVAHANNPNPSPYKLCFPQVTGLPQSDGHGGFTFPYNPPQIDGVIPGDTGWTNAFRYIFQNGTNSPLGAVQANQKNNVLYFGFQVTADYDFDQWDAIVLGFDNTNGADPQRYTYIYITPLTTGFGATSGQLLKANQIQVWQSSDGSTWTARPVGPAWVTASASSAGAQTNPETAVLGWNVELSVDNSNPNGPKLPTGAGTGFGLYMNAIRTNAYGPQAFPDTQFTWPPAVVLVDDTDPTKSSPIPGSWGNGTLDTSQTCSGVYLNSWDIWNTVTRTSDGTVLAAQTNSISWDPGQANTFTANVHNSGLSPAVNVNATFKIANFGMPAPSEWQKLGLYPPSPGTGSDDSVPNNPTANLTIPADNPMTLTPGTQAFSAGPWTLGTANRGYYSTPGNKHQCVLVELDSPVGDTTFLNRSTWNNFDLEATASVFTGDPATISADYPAVSGRANQTFELAVSQQEVTPGTNYPLLNLASRQAAATKGGEVHYLEYTVSGCRLTGKNLKMEGPPTVNADNRIIAPGQSKTFENCESSGAYGYLIRHQGPVKTWQTELTASGNGVKMNTLGQNQYELAIPQGKKAQLVSVVTPSVTKCNVLPFGATGVFALGGILVVGMVAYRPRKKQQNGEKGKG